MVSITVPSCFETSTKPSSNLLVTEELSSEAPENSLEAIDLAISSLSDGVEIDVQETKDGVVIVCHDASLKRIAGKKINIADVTYEELKQYDISYYFSKDHEFTYIPTLEEVMSLVKGRAHL